MWIFIPYPVGTPCHSWEMGVGRVETEHEYGPPEGMILVDELKEAIRCMSSHKATGGDEVISEYYKASATARQYLLRLINQIWVEEDIPNEWMKGIIYPIYKQKGARGYPVNYRMICLLSHSYRIFAVILVRIIQMVVEAAI